MLNHILISQELALAQDVQVHLMEFASVTLHEVLGTHLLMGLRWIHKDAAWVFGNLSAVY